MGAFFLLCGTVLFFAGLACLLMVFTSTTRRLRNTRQTSAYFRNRSSLKDGLLTGIGIVFIVAAQGLFWFHNQVSIFIPFEDSVPRVQMSFLYEEFRTPRLILQSIDQNSQLGAQMIPFTGEKVAIGAEVITWKKMFRILGLKDCYHINGVYYQNGDSSESNALAHLPDYNLNGGPSGLASLIGSLGQAFPADIRPLMSAPVAANARYQYLVLISSDSIYSTQSIDNKATASYPK